MNIRENKGGREGWRVNEERTKESVKKRKTNGNNHITKMQKFNNNKKIKNTNKKITTGRHTLPVYVLPITTNTTDGGS